MQSTECKNALIWEAYRRTPEAPWVLAADDGRIRKYAEDPLRPEEEALKELSLRLNNIALIIMPPCSPASIEALLANSSNLKKILVVDSNAQRLQAWKNFAPKTKKLEILQLESNENSALKKLKEKLNSHSVEMFQGKSAVYIPGRFKRLDMVFSAFLEKSALKIQQEACTAAAFKTTRSWHVTMNQLLNLKYKKAKKFIREGESAPFVIVGAGPSLGINVKTLAEYSDRAIIISCDAALNALLENGVRPDFIASAEDLNVSWRFIAKHPDKLKDIPLILPLCANNLIVKNYPGELIFTENDNSPSWLSAFASALPQINTGQCVGHYAHNIARYLNASEIIMVGFDLALKGEKYHCESMGVPYFEDGSRSFDLLEVEGVDGAKLKTDISLRLHLEGFENIIRDSEIPTIDATEGGARKKGTAVMTLEEALKDKKTVSAPRLQDNESFNSLDRNGFYSRLFSSVKKLGVKLENISEETGKMTLDSVNNPISCLPLESDEFIITSSCCNFLLMSKFAEMANSFSEENFSDFKEALSSMLNELQEGTLFIEAVSGLIDFKAKPETFICLTPPGKNHCHNLIEQLPENASLTSSETSLPDIWKEIQKRNASTVIAFDGNILPDAWAAPGINCIDIKTRFEPQPFERSLWIPGYQAACISEDLLKRWRDYIPLDIDCKLFKDILNHG